MRFYCLLTLLFWLGASPPLLVAAEKQQHYPLTMAATQRIIEKWLTKEKQEYRISPEAQRIVQIHSSKGETKWRIRLTPRSSLATVVSIQVSGEGEEQSSKADLFQYLGDNSGTPESSVEQQPEIPAAVLDKIGTVACLRAGTGDEAVQFSGVTIDEQGLILCTAHDLREREEVSIISTINTLFKGDIVRIDFERDLALIQIQSGREQVANIEEGRNLLSMGEKLYSIGCPVGLRGTVNSGSINGPPRLADNQPMWQVSMEIQPGSSGSPVFDSEGNFVALVKGRHRVSEGIGFLIPLEVIIDFLGEQEAE